MSVHINLIYLSQLLIGISFLLPLSAYSSHSSIEFYSTPYCESEGYNDNRSKNPYQSINNINVTVKDNEFWIIHDQSSLVQVTNATIAPNGEWLDNDFSVPSYIRYKGVVSADDFEYIHKWLHLNDVQFFSLTGRVREADFDILYNWYENMKSSHKLSNRKIYKLIWLNGSSTLHQMGQGECGFLPEEWVENHRKYHLIASHYKNYTKK